MKQTSREIHNCGAPKRPAARGSGGRALPVSPLAHWLQPVSALTSGELADGETHGDASVEAALESQGERFRWDSDGTGSTGVDITQDGGDRRGGGYVLGG